MTKKKIFNKTRPKVRTIKFYPFTTIENLIKWVNYSRYKNIYMNKYPYRLLIVDFSDCKSNIKPYHITPLACIIHEYHRKSFKIKLKNIPIEISDYLSSFNFEQFCNNTSQTNYFNSSDSKIMPLYLIDKTSFNIYPNLAENYFETNHFDGRSLFSLSSSLAELMNNIFDHSGSKIPGYTFTQYNTKTNYIITGVCDFGVGIPVKVNRFLISTGENRLSKKDALMKAFEYKFSTMSKPHNKGYGLDNILSVVKELKSKVLIISNNVIFRVLEDGSEQATELSENFPGTLFVIWINTNALPEKEDEMDEINSL